MKTILAIDLGKRNSVFCKLNTSSLKPEYFTAKTDPQRFHDIFIELDREKYSFSRPPQQTSPTHFPDEPKNSSFSELRTNYHNTMIAPRRPARVLHLLHRPAHPCLYRRFCIAHPAGKFAAGSS